VAGGTDRQAVDAAEVAGFFAQFSQGPGAITDAASTQAEQVVTAASTAAAAAAETTAAAREGSPAVDETAGSVSQIVGGVTEATTGMERLSGQAQHIGEISSTIRELADQSNLLALNAAIEAARVGEYGRANTGGASLWWPMRCTSWPVGPPSRQTRLPRA
jgi:methyl-accepting chemotaxis protein